MPKIKMHLGFDLSYTHMGGRWRMPGSWVGHTFPDVGMYENIARIAERGCLDMIFSGDGTGVPNTWRGSRDAAVEWGIGWPRQDLNPIMVAMSRVTRPDSSAAARARKVPCPARIATRGQAGPRRRITCRMPPAIRRT